MAYRDNSYALLDEIATLRETLGAFDTAEAPRILRRRRAFATLCALSILLPAGGYAWHGHRAIVERRTQCNAERAALLETLRARTLEAAEAERLSVPSRGAAGAAETIAAGLWAFRAPRCWSASPCGSAVQR